MALRKEWAPRLEPTSSSWRSLLDGGEEPGALLAKDLGQIRQQSLVSADSGESNFHLPGFLWSALRWAAAVDCSDEMIR